MQKAATPSINLAKNRGEKFIDRAFVWALSIGRVLVIFTEALALGAFLYRFGLDRQILDLRDRITQEEAIVKLLKTNETTYRNLQDRLSLAKNIDTNANTQLKMFNNLMGFIPSDMIIQDIAYSTTDVHINATIGSIISLSSFVNKLKSYDAVEKVSIDKLENKSSTGQYLISITAVFKAGKSQSI